MLWHTDWVGHDRSILHVDMDAFFVGVEVKHDPSLAGRPVIVGGSGDRGVVASCSYEARAYGIHSAMPSARARRLCPSAVFLPGRFALYQDHSRMLHEVLHRFTPLVEPISLDEAFLDVTGARRLLGGGDQIAWSIRQCILDEMGLGASVGVATSKLVAKLASKAAKPQARLPAPVPGLGVKVVEPGAELAFLHPLPVGALWGVGPATGRRLERLGVATVGDLAAAPPESLVAALGPSAGRHLHALAWGRDTRPVEPEREAKSVSHEQTFAHDHHDPEPLRREVVRLADGVAMRLREAAVAGATVVLKVRFGDFRTITRSHTVTPPVNTGPALARLAQELLDGIDPSPGVRLLGVGVSGLAPRVSFQPTLDDAASGDGEDVARAIDDIRRRFGAGAVGPASLLDEGGLRPKRQGDQQWGPDAQASGNRVSGDTLG
ncbi:MAG: DNA polymerase IV [Actinomycetota bacterium]|nr:DNA polymerase IV [Actinomycetota bacterium]